MSRIKDALLEAEERHGHSFTEAEFLEHENSLLHLIEVDAFNHDLVDSPLAPQYQNSLERFRENLKSYGHF